MKKRMHRKYDADLTEKEVNYTRSFVYRKFKNKLLESPEIEDEHIEFGLEYVGEPEDKFTNKISFRRKKSLLQYNKPNVFEDEEGRDGIAKFPQNCNKVRLISEWKPIKFFFPNEVKKELQLKLNCFAIPILSQPKNSYGFLKEYFHNECAFRDQILHHLMKLYGNNFSDWFIERHGRFKYFISFNA